MPIEFSVNHQEHYHLSRFIGKVSDSEILDSCADFFRGDEWVAGYDELVDLSKLDATDITVSGLKMLSKLISEILSEYRVNPIVSVYAPGNLAFGLARMYSLNASYFEIYSVFRDLDEAKSWLKLQQQNRDRTL